ncbi:MAG: acetate/propionate family kinase [Hyphomicrobiales bacterium]
MGLILVLNAGSSSVKFALVDVDPTGGERELARGHVDGLGLSPRWSVRQSNGTMETGEPWLEGTLVTHKAAIGHILAWIDQHHGLSTLMAAGHRVVHGGEAFTEPVILKAENLNDLRALTPLAPLHQPHNLSAIDSLFELVPTLPQIACFDTAFHATMPVVARNFALPRSITAQGVRRYGFHGLSYEFIASALRDKDPALYRGKVIVAHLGNGASLCALNGGKSVATTMGFSALDGLMMGTRSGSIDPAVIFHLMREMKLSSAEVETMLYQKSGLLGVSGLSSDMRVLRAAAPDMPEAREAIELFTYRILRDIGSLIAALGEIDGLVFTAGIGENDADLRADILNGLKWAGFSLDAAANEKSAERITTDGGARAYRLATNEEIMIARHSTRVMTESTV